MTDEDPRAVATAGLVQLRARVDEHFAAAVRRTPEAFACREGCALCCQVQLGVTTVEADRVRQGLDRLERRAPALRERVRAQGHDRERPDCALLVDGRCVVYDERPLICRSHGLPVRVTHDDGTHDTAVCELNFTTTTPPAASVLVLEALDAPLSIIARMWSPNGGRVSLAELAAEAVSPCPRDPAAPSDRG